MLSLYGNPYALGRAGGIQIALGPLALGLALGMYISYCLSQFRLRWVANANMFFGGIWASVFVE